MVVLVLVDGRGRRRRGRGSFHRRRCWLVVMFDLCLIVVAAVVVGSGSAGDGVVRGCLTIVSFFVVVFVVYYTGIYIDIYIYILSSYLPIYLSV